MKKLLFVLVLVSACDGEDVPTDAGMSDAGMSDAGMPDAGPLPCGAAFCATGEACVADECIDACGAPMPAMFGASVGPGLSAVESFCRPFPSAFANDGPVVFDLTTATDGLDFTLTINTWNTDGAGEPVVVAETTATIAADLLAFGSGYLDRHATSERFLFGYTTTADDASGEVIAMAGDGTTASISGPGNFDAQWIDDARVVVNAPALGDRDGGQGLYVDTIDATDAFQVAIGPGEFSGSVAVREDFVVTGGATEDFAPLVFAIPRTAFDAAVDTETPITIGPGEMGIEVRDPDGAVLAASTFTFLGDRLLVVPYFGAITAYTVSWDGTTLTLSDPEVLAMGPAFNGVLDVGGGRLLLTHSGGALLVER